ncbi:G protein-coupled receptor [Aphelenchoides bicaudatus]|nr:G protein-coupled receptor [Aphelenchoides bicaudatus]
MTIDIDYAFTLFQHMILLFVNRIEVFHGTKLITCLLYHNVRVLAIHFFCSIVCLVLTMHRYTHWLLGHYQPLLNARHLSKCDMMRSLVQQNQTSNLSIGLRQLPSVKGTQWFYKKWNFSFAANQSFRPHMEDRMSYLHVPQTHNVSMYSVFDGHGGAQVADFLEQNFNKRVFLMLEEKEQRIGQDIYKDDELIEQALIDEIGRIDADVTTPKTSYTGSTLISAILNHNRYLTVINVGDSRCIGADFEGNLVQLSVDHKPSQPEERARIETAGGFVEHYGVERVNGILAVSRAFGDTDLKRHRFVISKPDITRIDLEKRPLSYILLASDGFWDVVSNHEAILEVNYLLEKRGNFKFSKPEEKKQVEDKPVPQPKSVDTPKKRPIDSPTNKEFGLAVFQAPAVKRPKVEKGTTKEKPTKSNSTSETSGSDRSEIETLEAEKQSASVLLETKASTDSTFSTTKTSSTEPNNKKQVDVAAHLVKLALKRRSLDNISVFFVRLDKF